MNSSLARPSDELPNEEEVRVFLKSHNIPGARIDAGVSILKQAAYDIRVSFLMADRARVDVPPETICEGADLIERAYIREQKKRTELFKKHASKLNKMSMDLWSQGIKHPRDLKRASFSIGDEERYFHAMVQDLLEIYKNLEKELLKRVSEHESAIERDINDRSSAEKSARNRFIQQCCIAWVVPMRQKFTFTTGTGQFADEAQGPLANFILEACKGVVSHHNIDDKKLLSFLKSNKGKIEEAIEVKLGQLRLRAERYLLLHDISRSGPGEFDS